ncbi:hypothetical protein CMI38_00215 [Candidatus Pacearchaeota archaeon]|jgi:hypothetical protein|nr:hypothetical protein [Candidatus Pacearchaeota archaeon]|tara:strand:+ start:10244 stop:10636 length:393 start_codon:yes stop_codon:yes gene_type:complete
MTLDRVSNLKKLFLETYPLARGDGTASISVEDLCNLVRDGEVSMDQTFKIKSPNNKTITRELVVDVSETDHVDTIVYCVNNRYINDSPPVISIERYSAEGTRSNLPLVHPSDRDFPVYFDKIKKVMEREQ